MPQAQQCIQEIQEEAKKYFRIYISSIHKVGVIENMNAKLETYYLDFEEQEIVPHT